MFLILDIVLSTVNEKSLVPFISVLIMHHGR